MSASLPGSAQIAAALVGPAQMSNGAILNVTFDTIGTGTTPITVTSQKVSAAAGAMLSYTSSGATVTVTSIFTGDPVFARFTPIRARHVTELRSLIDAKRIARGLGAFPWTDPSPAVVRTVHIVELRAALAAVYVAAGQQPPSYTDPTLTAKQTTVRAVHINELRTALVNAP